MTAEYVVHIVDDDEAMRHSLAFMLTVSGFAVRLHATALEFLGMAHSISRGCLVTDLRMPDMSGVDLLRKLKLKDIALPTIIISGHGDIPMAVAAMKAGASDFIEKPFEADILIGAIRAVMDDRSVQPAQDAATARQIRERLATLTAREKDVLLGVVDGLPNKTIAHELQISPRTVEVHRANVMAKMNARSLPELVRLAISVNLTAAI
jgi:two-component system response regulator FixJ